MEMAIESAVQGGGKMVAIASANMTNEEAFLANRLLKEKLGATIGVMVDSIGPIKMKSRSEWHLGTQGGPNFRGVQSVIGANGADIDALMTSGAEGVDVLYVCDAGFSDRTSDPSVVANLRKAKFLIVHSWDANHPLNDVADVLLPGTILAEKEGSFTNLQNTVQKIHQAYPPKGQAVTELELYRRIGSRLFPEGDDFRSANAEALFATLQDAIPAFRDSPPAGAPTQTPTPAVQA